jgi:hypothetical protein
MKRITVLAVIIVIGMAFGGCVSGSRTQDSSDQNPDATEKVIRKEANQANLIFLATADTVEFATQIANAHDNGFTWAADLAVKDESISNFITGQTNQLLAAGSGFDFRIKTNPSSQNLRAAIGFNSMFYFTAEDDNLGQTTFDALISALEELPQMEGWVLPEYSVLTDLGIHVFTTYNNAAKDITSRISFGLNISEKEEGKILFSYGAVMVDRAIANFEQEGFSLFVSDEDEIIWSDGTADGIISGKWWIGKEE